MLQFRRYPFRPYRLTGEGNVTQIPVSGAARLFGRESVCACSLFSHFEIGSKLLFERVFAPASHKRQEDCQSPKQGLHSVTSGCSTRPMAATNSSHREMEADSFFRPAGVS